ncbi:MAG: YqeG family HAD IIIA-type phosphatase [Lachnospiraceae bacterium]|nr:YqeG family HAD IIIA-type phosphatase [Lachnospiraceae bacterium]
MVASAEDVPYEALYERGFRLVILDIDNTIVPHDAPADEHATALFYRIHASGLRSVVISNNNRARVQPFAEAVGTHFICKAGKPKSGAYQKAMAKYGVTRQETFAVGDQIFTDQWGAMAAGIRMILVSPIDPAERQSIVFKRKLERPLLWIYRRVMKKNGTTYGGEIFS